MMMICVGTVQYNTPFETNQRPPIYYYLYCAALAPPPPHCNSKRLSEHHPIENMS